MEAPPDQPRLSVVVAAYNQSEWLPRCIESVQRQTIDAIEIIIVDDGSSDETWTTAKSLAAIDARITCLRTATNSGPSAARDLGCRAARGAYVATLDADDIYLSPRKLEDELNLVQTHSTPERPAIGYSRYVLLDSALSPLPGPMQPKEPLLEGDLLAPMLSRSLAIPRDFVMLKSLYLDIGGYDPEIPIYEDWDLKLRLAARANFFRTDLDGTGYVQHGGGLHETHPSEREAWLGCVFRKNIGLLDRRKQPKVMERFASFMEKRGWSARLSPSPVLSDRQRLGEGLAFLLSMPRAGSTLLQRMLTGHYAIQSRSENWLMLLPLLARETDALWAPHNQELAATALDEFVQHLPGGEDAYRYWLRTCFAGLYNDAKGAEAAGYYLDKTPRYHLVWERLMELFPRAKFILLWRHPLAVLLSMLEDMDGDIQRMPFWQIDLQQGLDNLLALSASGQAVDIRYEDLVVEPAPVLSRVTDHLRLRYEPNMTDLAGSTGQTGGQLGDKKQARTASILDRSGADRWRSALRENPTFAALADAYLRTNKDALCQSPYDVDEMRELVPELNDTKLDFLFKKPASPDRRKTLRSKADIARVDRWQKRLARIGPLPHALGRFAWQAYNNFRK